MNNAKKQLKPLIDSLYFEQYPSAKWSYEKVEYDILDTIPYSLELTTYLRSDKRYGIVVKVQGDTTFQVTQVIYFMEGCD